MLINLSSLVCFFVHLFSIRASSGLLNSHQGSRLAVLVFNLKNMIFHELNLWHFDRKLIGFGLTSDSLVPRGKVPSNTKQFLVSICCGGHTQRNVGEIEMTAILCRYMKRRGRCLSGNELRIHWNIDPLNIFNRNAKILEHVLTKARAKVNVIDCN